MKRFLSPVSYLLVVALILTSCSGSEAVVEGNGPPPTITPTLVVTATPTSESTSEPATDETEPPVEEATAEPLVDSTSEPTTAPTATPEPESDQSIESASIEIVDDPEPEPLIFRPEEVAPRIDELVAAYEGIFGIVLATQDGTIFYESSPDESMEAASIYKLAVMVEVFRQINDGRFSLDDGVLIVDGFLVEGPDNIGWESVGSYYTVETLLYLMITLSSNVASYALLDLVGSANVNYTMSYYGLDGIEIRWSPLIERPSLYPPEPEEEESPVDEAPAPEEEAIPDEEHEEELEQLEEEEPSPDSEGETPEGEPLTEDEEEPGFPGPIIPAPLSTTSELQGFNIPMTMRADYAYNVVTARAVANLLLLILNGQAVSEDASRMMMDLLASQHIFGGLSLGVPDGVLAHKTGYLPDGVVNDAGIISTPVGPVVAVVLTEHVREDLAYEVMGRVSQVVWDIGTAAVNSGP